MTSDILKKFQKKKSKSRARTNRNQSRSIPSNLSNSSVSSNSSDSDDSDQFLFDIAENLTDNSQSMRKILFGERNNDTVANSPDINSCDISGLNSRASFLSQFDDARFDSTGEPSALNDVYQSDQADKTRLANLERSISSAEGWTKFCPDSKMTYEVVPDSELAHDNMVPFFNKKNNYGSNELRNNHVSNLKKEIFTGTPSVWKHKTENGPLFCPMKEMGFVNGTPVRSEEETSRYISGRYMQGVKPTQEVRTTPGLNLDYNEVGTQGYHDFYRVLPKTVDELRTKNNPKISYKGRVIEGMRGQKRPIQAPVITHKPQTFKINKQADLLPQSSDFKACRVKDNFDMKDTHRSNQSIEYTGGAFSSVESKGMNVPENMRGKMKCSTRQNFTLPKPLQKFSKDNISFNPNINSYNLPFNARVANADNKYISTPGIKSGTYSNVDEIPGTTLKELISANPNNFSQIQSNDMRGTTHPSNPTETTLKEMMIENKFNSMAPSLNSPGKLYNVNVPETTIKELSILPTNPTNMANDTNIYANFFTAPDSTLKEMTSQIPENTFVVPVNQQTQPVPIQDGIATTLKETTQYTRPQIFTPQQTAQVIRPQTALPQTMKEITSQIIRNNFVTPLNQQSRTYLQDTPRETIKETTIEINRNTNIAPSNRKTTLYMSDTPRETIKETTIQIPYSKFVTPTNLKMKSNVTNTPDTTLKEITEATPRNNYITPSNQAVRSHLQDTPRTTQKELIIRSQTNTNVGANRMGSKVELQDELPTTLKDLTANQPNNSLVSSGIGYKTNLQDTLRTTQKEQLISIPYNTNIGQSQNSRGAGSSFDWNPLRTTTKEQTIMDRGINHVSAVNQSQGNAMTADRTPTESTLKEMIIDNKYITGVSNDSNGKGYGYISETVDLDTTIKELTLEEKYIRVPQGETREKSYYSNYNFVPDDKKESVSVYRPPTTSGPKTGPDPDKVIIPLKKAQKENSHINFGYSYNTNLDRLTTCNQTKKLNLVPPELLADPTIMTQLSNNPYNIPYLGQC